ncbi:MAG: GPR endopeptidase [Bacillota bacterium]|nr:GPR endopeptidase [Bacillota bacterium]
MRNIRTDLAVEADELYRQGNAAEAGSISGIESQKTELEYADLTTVYVKTDEAAQKIGKPKGQYITIESPYIKTGEYYEELCDVLSVQLKKLCPNITKDSLVLVAGLGNWNITPDSIGPKTVNMMLVTRHLFSAIPEQIDQRMKPLCAIAPGVLGLTGIETAEIISSVVERVKPTYVIAIDALAARSSSRVSTTIQMSDTGISPGSGVHNRRTGLSKETLGVPVIAIGIPTVSDAVSMVSDAVENLASKCTSSPSEDVKDEIIKNLLYPGENSLMVTPKDIDMIVARASKLIAGGINITVHEGLSQEEIAAYMA